MLNGFFGGDVLDMTEAGSGARQIARIPELRCLQTCLLPMSPTSVRPPAAVVIAAVVDELAPFAVGDRDTADAEGGHVDHVCRAFVVQRVGFGDRVHAEHEFTAGHQHRRSRHA